MLNDLDALYLFASDFYGVKEKIGAEHNPVILGWFKAIGHQWVTDDETAWCSCFINYCCMMMGLEYSGKLDARSWLSLPGRVEPRDLRRGHIVIFWREHPASWKGHVGLFVARDLHYIYVLGGNQDNMVCIQPYPAERLIGIREPKRIAFR